MINEKQTRKQVIDQKLIQAGWKLDDPMMVGKEFSIQTFISANNLNEPSAEYGTTQYSDYVLHGKDAKVLAVVEAKRTSVDAETGQEQAKQYCLHISENQSGETPFCFYTNGHDIFFWDIGNYPPRKIHGFPTREDFERMRHIRKARKPLAGELINNRIAGRDYQLNAIRTTMETIEARKRKILLVMATGTGKTRTCIALVDALMRAGWIERTLFLVDRIALRDQALEAFKEHLPNEPRWPKTGEKSIATDRRIYISTYPTMLNIIRDADNPLSPHFFDLVVVDESHRSIYNTYKEILDYFDTLTLGLTATPTNVIDHNTFNLFDEPDGIPTYAYTYEEAVNHVPPYLCNFQVTKIITRFQNEGINMRTLTLEDQMRLIAEGKDVDEINFEGSELEKTVRNKGTNALIVREFMEESIKDKDGVLPGKTIFFCASIGQARQIETIFNDLYPEYCGEIARVLVSDDPRVYGKGGLLHQFTHSNMPRVAISVDMLDTGVDIREITNLVFAKPVYSYTKFWQMIGRGTRLLESGKIKPWCTEKDQFLILDCWDNFEYFRLQPEGKTPAVQIPLPVRLAGLRITKIQTAIQARENRITQKEIQRLRLQIAQLPTQSIVVRDSQAQLETVQEDAFWQHLTDDKINYLNDIIKPLFRTVSGVDYKEMRFEKDIVEVSLAHLHREEQKFETLRDSIIEQISELPLTIRAVAEHQELIHQSQTPHFWATITEEKFDLLIEHIAPLARYRESIHRPGIRKVNYKDVVFRKEHIEFGPQHESLSIAGYRELVEERINALVAGNPLLQKLSRGENLTENESGQLAGLLHDERPYITVDILRRVYNHRKAHLEQFIRHILGIEQLETFPETVARLFDEFIAGHTYLNSRQLDFLNLLRTYLIEKGNAEKKDLIAAPFTRIHPDGIRGVFTNREIEEIIQFIQIIAA